MSPPQNQPFIDLAQRVDAGAHADPVNAPRALRCVKHPDGPYVHLADVVDMVSGLAAERERGLALGMREAAADLRNLATVLSRPLEGPRR